jgi:hypothetical protein
MEPIQDDRPMNPTPNEQTGEPYYSKLLARGGPIQDDIETLRTILNWVWATNPSTGSVAHHNARHGREALDRLVAELQGATAERDSLVEYLGETANAIENRNVQREEIAALLRKTQARFG